MVLVFGQFIVECEWLLHAYVKQHRQIMMPRFVDSTKMLQKLKFI